MQEFSYLNWKKFYSKAPTEWLKDEYFWCLKQSNVHSEKNYYIRSKAMKNILDERNNSNIVLIPNKIIQQIKENEFNIQTIL